MSYSFSLNGRQYTSNLGLGSINRPNTPASLFGSPNLVADYPDVADMVHWAEGPMDQRDPTKEAFHNACNDDRLWILTCQGARAELDRWGVRRNREGDVLRGLFQMGQYSWRGPQTLDANSIRSIRYSTAIGMELLTYIEGVDQRVRL